MNDEQPGYLGDGTYRARWLRAVIRSTRITDSVRVLLMTLALHMDASGRVSVPREDLAALLGRNERKVGEKVKMALESGYLARVVRGQKHQVAVYQATIDGVSMTPVGPAEGDPVSMPPGGHAGDSQGADFYDPEPNSQGADFYDPETQGADLRMSPVGPAEHSQEAPRGARLSFKGVGVGEDVDLEDSDSLFDLDAASQRENEPKPKPAKTRRKPETEIPSDFAVTADMRAWATTKGYTVDLDRQTIRFINHAHQNQRRCRDWIHAWRNWIDIAQERADDAAKKPAAKGGNGSGSQVPPRGPRQNPFRSKRETA